MEVASGEHGDAIFKLVNAVNDGKSKSFVTQNCIVSVLPESNEKIINTLIANTSSESNGIVLHDSVIVDIDLVKQSSKSGSNNRLSVSIRETQESLLQSSESEINTKKIHIHGFPTSTWTQFWILLKRTFLCIIRDQTLTQMRLVSHIVVGAIIGMIYYGIGNDAGKIMSNAGCIFFTTLFVMFTGSLKFIGIECFRRILEKL